MDKHSVAGVLLAVLRRQPAHHTVLLAILRLQPELLQTAVTLVQAPPLLTCASKHALAAALPEAPMKATCSGSQVSSVHDRTCAHAHVHTAGAAVNGQVHGCSRCMGAQGAWVHHNCMWVQVHVDTKCMCAQGAWIHDVHGGKSARKSTRCTHRGYRPMPLLLTHAHTFEMCTPKPL
jgi:hypothetical protein